MMMHHRTKETIKSLYYGVRVARAASFKNLDLLPFLLGTTGRTSELATSLEDAADAALYTLLQINAPHTGRSTY